MSSYAEHLRAAHRARQEKYAAMAVGDPWVWERLMKQHEDERQEQADFKRAVDEEEAEAARLTSLARQKSALARWARKNEQR